MKFKDLDKTTKQNLHLLLNEKVNDIGGKFYFLQMLEDIRSINQALLKKTNSLHYDTGKISWNKSIFPDKLNCFFNSWDLIEPIEDVLTYGGFEIIKSYFWEEVKLR